jgi:hypothetical protein
VVGVAVLASLAAGIGGELLTRAAPWNEGIDPGFSDYGSRGVLIGVRGLAVVTIALAIGSLVPGQLAALLLAAATLVVLFGGLEIAMDAWRRDAAEATAGGTTQSISGHVYRTFVRDDATGEALPIDEYFEVHDELRGELPVGVTVLHEIVPQRRYGEFVLRESAVLALATVLAAAGAGALVSSRRP